jgi:hypothetical protein
VADRHGEPRMTHAQPRLSPSVWDGGAFLQNEISVGALKVFPGVRADFQNATFSATLQPNQ